MTLILMKHRIMKFDRNAPALPLFLTFGLLSFYFWFEEGPAVNRFTFLLFCTERLVVCPVWFEP